MELLEHICWDGREWYLKSKMLYTKQYSGGYWAAALTHLIKSYLTVAVQPQRDDSTFLYSVPTTQTQWQIPQEQTQTEHPTPKSKVCQVQSTCL